MQCTSTGSTRVQDSHSIIHSANLESAIHCTRTGSTVVGSRPLTFYNSQCQSRVSKPLHPIWGLVLTPYNSQCESRVSHPLHSHRIYLSGVQATYFLQFAVRIPSQQSTAPDLGLSTYSLQSTVRIPSQTSIALAPDPLEWGPGHLPSIIHGTNPESASYCTISGAQYLLPTIHSANPESAIYCTRTGST